MQTGKETWKWGFVVLLLAIFLITANQAYQHIASQEDYPPPDDYQKGDSWDLEHQGGPGAGQPMQMPSIQKSEKALINPNEEKVDASLSAPETMIIDEDIDWSQSD